MATPRLSNQDRAAYRTRCRQKLSEHISNKLAISIEPADVRLITSPDDPYTWRVLPEKQHLFKKHLSKHSIGAYRELCRGVGVSFEAVPTAVPGDADERNQFERPENITSPEISFTTVIEQLKSDKLELIGERTGIEQEISKANELKRRAEDEATRLRSIVQASEIDKQVLQQQVHSLTGMVSYFRNTTMTSVDDFINRLKHDLNSCTGE